LMMSLWDALRMNMMISYQELVRTFPSIQPLTSSALLLDEKESFLLFFISFLVSPAQPAIRNIMSIKIFTIIPPVKEG
ncbi:hypothetical protein VBL72_24390, partial [Enterobacter hormaechei]|nr:hypothetical protein [Enterobacter hormaechei]